NFRRIEFHEGDDSSRIEIRSEMPQRRRRIAQIRQDEAPDQGVVTSTWSIAFEVADFEANLHIANCSNSLGSESRRVGMLFNSVYAATWANQPANEHRNVSGSAANLQNLHSGSNARCSEQLFRLPFRQPCLPGETPELFG